MKGISALLFFFMIESAIAQDNKLLFHYSRHKEAVYNPGDVISFRLRGSKEKITKEITEVTGSTVIFGLDTIAPAKITHVYVDKKSKAWFAFRYKYTKLFLTAGVGYFLLHWINSKEIDRSTLVVSGSLLAAAGISALIIKDYIKLKGQRKLVILR